MASLSTFTHKCFLFLFKSNYFPKCQCLHLYHTHFTQKCWFLWHCVAANMPWCINAAVQRSTNNVWTSENLNSKQNFITRNRCWTGMEYWQHAFLNASPFATLPKIVKMRRWPLVSLRTNYATFSIRERTDQIKWHQMHLTAYCQNAFHIWLLQLANNPTRCSISKEEKQLMQRMKTAASINSQLSQTHTLWHRQKLFP